MGKPTLADRFRTLVGRWAWRAFLWSTGISEEEYWRRIFVQELGYRGEEFSHNFLLTDVELTHARDPERVIEEAKQRMKDELIDALAMRGYLTMQVEHHPRGSEIGAKIRMRMVAVSPKEQQL